MMIFRTLGAALHGALHGLLDGAAEGDATLELFGDVARDERGIELGDANLGDIDAQAHALGGEVLEVAAQLFDVLAAAADHDAGLGGVERDAKLVGAAFDVDA